MKGNSGSLSHLAGVLSLMIFGCRSLSLAAPLPLSVAPIIVIRQYPDYPLPGHDSAFPGGLIAVLWPDGRIIRPSSVSGTVGKSYVDGAVSPKERDAFIAFLNSSAAVGTATNSSVPVHTATQSITVRRNDTTSKWTRVLPDSQSAWREIESRLLSIPIQDSHTIDWAVIRRSSWYD